ncbi:MAG: Txe/YoeB family addiction module toxin [Betaproteobacteria bacterium]|nr:Txe/YoeB family addiction module toxin [Betaproteobacteria bacterium]
MAGNRVPAQVSGKRRSSRESAARSGGGQGSDAQSAPARGAGFRIKWAPEALKDYRRWRNTNPSVANKVDALIADVLRSPFSGIGKPEPLKHKLAGHWSRRITHEHRLVYHYRSGLLSILSCRYHY